MNERKTSTLAIVSLIAGILGWTLLPLIGSLGAIITGKMARSEIRQSDGRIDGDGMALAGLILGWSMMIFWILLMIVGVFLFLGGWMWLATLGS
jgi:uncharacterized membrane protein